MEYLENTDLNLLVSGRKGGFVVINRVSYLKISGCAIEKSFNHVEGFRAKTAEAKALQYNRLVLAHLKRLFRHRERTIGACFLTTKTHTQ